MSLIETRKTGGRIAAVEVLEPRARDSWTHTRDGEPRPGERRADPAVNGRPQS